uniref:ATP synthase F0 subunit 6 n=1 Tax=Cochlostyla marinduquensis TaxID=2079772 RepID=UPI00233EA83B|nr:ATP synthase F0 subunit 6 [Cochlostyla marinduquensis]UIX22054.1 ATP synthase F0 subunit 6 [Cochlostyla marinduquensis]
MMADLFSSLDGARSVMIWLFPMLSLMFFMNYKYYMSSMGSSLMKIMYSPWMNKDTSRLYSFNLFLSSYFMIIITMNYMSLTPMVYTLSTNLLMVSTISLLFWLSLIISGLMYSPIKFMAHLVPSGAPIILTPFLVLIEMISILIRPITLTVRLVANMSAGHIILTLMSNASSYLLHVTNYYLIMLSIIVFYTLFEFFVSMVQAYIFTLLMTLYMNEHP